MDGGSTEGFKQAEKKLHAETEEVVLNVAHNEDVILTGKFEGEFPYIILADGASEAEFKGKFFSDLRPPPPQ